MTDLDRPMPYPESPHGFLTKAQVQRLTKAIDPRHVEEKRGLSYIAQFQARAEMTRIFGFGRWDSRVLGMEMIREVTLHEGDPGFPKNPKSKNYYVTTYRGHVEVNIRDYWGRPIATFSEWHAESNAPLPDYGEAHAMAITSVESYALRRALVGLGDRLGLGLYNGGKVDPLVLGTLQLTDPDSPQGPTQEEVAAAEKAKAERGGRVQGALNNPEAPPAAE